MYNSDFVVSPRPHGPWLISSDDLSFSTRLTILRCISQVWWKWGVSWVVLVSTMVSQNYQNQTIIGWPNVHLSLLCVCLFLFVLCLCLPLWLTREEKVESEEARQAGGAGRWGRERKRLHWFYLLLLLRWAHNGAQTLNLYYAKCNAKYALQDYSIAILNEDSIFSSTSTAHKSTARKYSTGREHWRCHCVISHRYITLYCTA